MDKDHAPLQGIYDEERYMRRFLVFLVAVLLLLPLTGCGSVLGRFGIGQGGGMAPPPAQTPEEAVERATSITGNGELPPGFQILGTYAVPDADNIRLVAYRFLRPTGDTPPRLIPGIGLQVVLREPDRWSPQTGKAIARTAGPPHLIEYFHITHQLSGNTVTAVLGHVLSPEVAAVEATFDDGQTLQTKVVDDTFVIVAPGASTVQQLRVLNSAGEMLRRMELPPPHTAF